MTDDIVRSLRRHCERRHGGHIALCLDCAADEIERLRRWKSEAQEVIARWDDVAALVDDLPLGVPRSAGVAREIERLRVECARLRSWVDALEPQVSYEAVRCPICLQATEQRFMQPLEPHAEGCPWREANRQEPPC